MSEEKKLTPKQELFCQEYLVDLNAAGAARRAGYSENSDDVIGWENLRKPEIQARIAQLRKTAAEGLNLTKERVLQELGRIGFGDLRALFNEDGSLKPISDWSDDTAAIISSVETDELFEGTGREREQIGFTKKVKSWDKIRALELITKILGHAAPEKIAQTDTDGNNVKPVQIVFTPGGPLDTAKE